MKNEILILILLGIAILAAPFIVTRIVKGNEGYNRYICAVNGKQEDCKTPQTKEQIKCENYYEKGLCNANGEVYPEYTKEALKIQRDKNK